MEPNINKEAKEILDKFGKDLEGIKITSKIKKDELHARKENEEESCDVEFKTIMFKNAPRKDNECLLVEKGSWN